MLLFQIKNYLDKQKVMMSGGHELCIQMLNILLRDSIPYLILMYYCNCTHTVLMTVTNEYYEILKRLITQTTTTTTPLWHILDLCPIPVSQSHHTISNGNAVSAWARNFCLWVTGPFRDFLYNLYLTLWSVKRTVWSLDI